MRSSSLPGPKTPSSCWEQESNKDRRKQIHSIVIKNGFPCDVLHLIRWAVDHHASAFIQAYSGKETKWGPKSMTWLKRNSFPFPKEVIFERFSVTEEIILVDNLYGERCGTFDYKRPLWINGFQYPTILFSQHCWGSCRSRRENMKSSRDIKLAGWACRPRGSPPRPTCGTPESRNHVSSVCCIPRTQ